MTSDVPYTSRSTPDSESSSADGSASDSAAGAVSATMPAVAAAGALAARWLFFRRFLAHPARLAAALPSSRSMARMVAAQVRRRGDDYVVELGAGTGAVTRALLEAGIPASRLIVVEVDEEMAGFLDDAFPGVSVIHGSARDIAALLPGRAAGRVGAVVCGVPVSLLPRAEQKAMAEAMLSLLPAGASFLAYTYRLVSPLPAAALGLVGVRAGFTLRNVVPASVWAYRRAAG